MLQTHTHLYHIVRTLECRFLKNDFYGKHVSTQIHSLAHAYKQTKWPEKELL